MMMFKDKIGLRGGWSFPYMPDSINGEDVGADSKTQNEDLQVSLCDNSISIS